jgi:hypothetical protein
MRKSLLLPLVALGALPVVTGCDEARARTTAGAPHTWDVAPADTVPTVARRLRTGLGPSNALRHEPLGDGRFVIVDWDNHGDLAILDATGGRTRLTHHNVEPWADGRALAIYLALLAIVAFARLRLGAHWPSDLAAALLVSGVWTAAVVYALRRAATVARRH